MIDISSLVKKYRDSLFPFDNFNLVQEVCAHKLVNTDSNVVVCAPTGSGKTVLFELAILRLLYPFEKNRPQGRKKIVYLGKFYDFYDQKNDIHLAGPLKALCQERYDDWTKKFKTLNVKCFELTGDSELNSISELVTTDIIITTPGFQLIVRKNI